MRNLYLLFICLGFVTCLNTVSAQIGSSCSSPDIISTLPYTAIGLNTSTTADNYDLGPCTSGSAYMAGNDYVFAYTPTNNEIVTITLSNVTAFTGTGIFVTDLCPDMPAATCVGQATGLTAPTLSSISLIGGTQYFIIVSSQVFLGQGQTTGFDIAIQSCGANPVAGFTFTQSGMSLNFTNTSTNGNTYKWLFGDEAIANWFLATNDTNPVHTYTGWGTYTVQMVATNNCGATDTISMNITLTCPGPAPVASFTYIANNTTVVFTNTSANTATSNWLYGDEAQIPPPTGDSISNPTHIYSQPGTYVVTLTVTSDSGCQNSFIDTLIVNCNLTSTPIASFSYITSDTTVAFTNLSTDATNYNWLFGDEPIFPPSTGDTATNPVHTYNGWGTYTVQLISSNCFSSDTMTVTYNLCTGTPPVASFTYSTNNTIATFLNTSSDAATSSWLFGDETAVPPIGDTTTNPIHNYAQPGTYYVELTVSSAGGCQSIFADSITVICNITAPPIAAFTYTVTDSTVTFTDATIDGTATTWLFGDEFFANWILGTNATNPVHSYAGYGNYNVQMIAQNCFSTDTVAVTVLLCNISTVPTADFTYTNNGLAVTFTNTSTNGDSYKWLFGDELVHTWYLATNGADQTHTYQGFGTYTVEMVVTNLCGITDTMTVVITLGCPGPAPIAAFTYTVDNTTVNFTNTSANGSTYEWLYGDEPIWQLNGDTTQNPTHSYTQAGTYIVSLTITTDSGCQSTFIDTLILTCNLSSIPVADFTYTYTDSTVTFTNTSIYGTSYLWLFGDELLANWNLATNATNPTHTYAGNGTYTVQMIANNCFSSDTISIDIVVCALPSASFLHFESGLNVNFLGDLTNATSFQWFFGDESNPAIPSDTVNISTLQHIYLHYGTYTVKLIAMNTCGTDTQQTNITLVCAAGNPHAGFSFTNTQGTVQFVNTSTNTTSYAWFFGDETNPNVPSSTSASPTHIYTSDSTYHVRMIATNGCGADTIKIDIVVIGSYVDMMSNSFNVTCYPNPVQEKLALEITDLAGEKINVRLITVLGSEIFSETIIASGNMFKKEYDLSNFSKGIYFLKTECVSGSRIIKIIVE